MNYDYDLIIVGAGPAGSTTALYAKRNRLKVLLLDKHYFPRDKICGDLIPKSCIHYLRELNVLHKIDSVSHSRIKGVQLSSAKGNSVKILLPPSYEDNYQMGFICHRKVFDNILVQEAKEKMDVFEGFPVVDLLINKGQVCGVKGKVNGNIEKEVTGKVIVGADGFNSVVSRHMNVYDYNSSHCLVAIRAYYEGIEDLNGLIEASFIDEFRPGYFWIFPVGNGIANVGLGTVHRVLKKEGANLRQVQHMLINSPFYKKRFKRAKRLGEIKGWNLPTASKLRKIHGNGYILVGDAAGLVNPLTGGGIDNAMRSGKIAAEILVDICKSRDYSASNLQKYPVRLWEELKQDELKSHYQLQRLGRFRWFYGLIDLMIKNASKHPETLEKYATLLIGETAIRKRNLIKIFLNHYMNYYK